MAHTRLGGSLRDPGVVTDQHDLYVVPEPRPADQCASLDDTGSPRECLRDREERDHLRPVQARARSQTARHPRRCSISFARPRELNRTDTSTPSALKPSLQVIFLPWAYVRP